MLYVYIDHRSRNIPCIDSMCFLRGISYVYIDHRSRNIPWIDSMCFFKWNFLFALYSHWSQEAFTPDEWKNVYSMCIFSSSPWENERFSGHNNSATSGPNRHCHILLEEMWINPTKNGNLRHLQKQFALFSVLFSSFPFVGKSKNFQPTFSNRRIKFVKTLHQPNYASLPNYEPS